MSIVGLRKKIHMFCGCRTRCCSLQKKANYITFVLNTYSILSCMVTKHQQIINENQWCNVIADMFYVKYH